MNFANLDKKIQEEVDQILSNTPARSISEIIKRAKEFNNVIELNEYLKEIPQDIKANFVWGILINNLPPDFIEANFEEILELGKQLEVDRYDSLEDFIRTLSDEIISKKYELLVNFVINNSKSYAYEMIMNKLFEVPGRLDNLENYKQLLNGLDQLQKSDIEESRKVDISFIKQNIIENLPNSTLKKNYKDVIERSNSLGEGTALSVNKYIELAKKIFEPDKDFEFDSKYLLEALSFIYGNAEQMYPKDKEKIISSIIPSLPTEFIEINMEYLLTLVNGKFPETTSLHLLKNLSGETISKYKDKLTIEISLENIGGYQNYLEYILSKEPNTIIQDGLAMKLISFIDFSEDNESEDFGKIKTVLEEYRKNTEMPDMEKYNKYIPESYSEELKEMDADEFDSFIKELELIKLVEGTISEKYCDYIIKQKLNKFSNINQNLDKYLPILKIAFGDKIKYLLGREGISGYSIEFFKNDGSRTLGYHNKFKKTIGILEDELINLDESNTHAINTAFHEVRHAVQAINHTTTDFRLLNGMLYNMIKEEIIREDDRIFYTLNYSRMFCEIDARLAGAKGQAEYLKYLGLHDDKVIEGSGKNEITLREIYKTAQIQESENQRLGTSKVNKAGKIISIKQKSAELIKKSPEWLQKYPVLALEFKENGERKSTKVLLEESLVVQDANIQDIYRKMFEGEITLDLNEVIDTLEYIAELLKKDGQKNRETLVEFISLIIKNETMPSLKNANTNSEEFKRILSTLRRIQEENLELEISKYINEKLSVFSEQKEFPGEKRTDVDLTMKAIKIILARNVNSIDDFDKILEDIRKISKENQYAETIAGVELESFLKKQLENKPTIDPIVMFEKSLDMVSQFDIPSYMCNFLSYMPANMLTEKIHGVLQVASNKGCDIGFETLIMALKKIKPEVLEDTRENVIEAFKRLSKTC